MSHKKRKSDVNLDVAGVGSQPSKKEKPWYEENAEVTSCEPPEKERRKSFLGGLLKKMRSSSTLKERNRAQSSSQLTVTTPSHQPIQRIPSSAASDTSFRSETSQESGEGIPVSSSVFRNADLLRFVERRERDATDSDMISYSTTSQSSLCSDLGSVSSLCTPSRNPARFARGPLRSSARSMPGESDLVNGLCNSVVRRATSSVSDSFVSPSGFVRTSSRRLMARQLRAGSMADLPEELDGNEAVSCDLNDSQFIDPNDIEGQSTPIAVEGEGRTANSGRKSSSRIRRVASKLLGNHKRTPTLSRENQTSMIVEPSGSRATTPLAASTLQLSRNTPSSTSLQRRVKKLVGMRDSSTNLGGPEVCLEQVSTTNSHLKRAKTDITKEKERHNRDRRFSDVSYLSSPANMTFDQSLYMQSMDERQRASKAVQLQEKKHAEVFLSKVQISSEPISTLIEKGEFDAVVVDCAWGKPVSPPAQMLFDAKTSELARRQFQFTSNFEKIIQRPEKPSLVLLNRMEEDGPWPLDRKVRNGVGNALRAVFKEENIKHLVLYPVFCRSEEEWNNVEMCLDPLLTILHNMLKFSHPDTFERATIAGITAENVTALQQCYSAYVAQNITPKLAFEDEKKEHQTTEAEI